MKRRAMSTRSPRCMFSAMCFNNTRQDSRVSLARLSSRYVLACDLSINKHRSAQATTTTISRGVMLCLPFPSCLSAPGCDLNALLCRQCGCAGQTALTPERDGGRVLRGRWSGSGSFPNGFQKNLAGKLDWVAWAFGCHVPSIGLRGCLESSRPDFKLTHYPPTIPGARS
jgi:hypothetical protein